MENLENGNLCAWHQLFFLHVNTSKDELVYVIVGESCG